MLRAFNRMNDLIDGVRGVDPLRFFRNRAFSAANVTSLLMSFGMFGSIFLLAQFFHPRAVLLSDYKRHLLCY